MAENQRDRIEETIKNAGKLILALKKRGLLRYVIEGTQVKAEVDQTIHNFLVQNLKKISSHTPVVSEEDIKNISVSSLRRAEECFIIDPIDGTASLIGGFKGYVVQLAYMRKGLPIFSFVYAPEYGDLYSSLRGDGAFLNNKRIKVDKVVGKIIFIDNYPCPSKKIEKMMKKFPRVAYQESGSLGLKICKIADGSAHVFYKDVIVKDWDIAPPALILTEAGGHLMSRDKKEIVFFENEKLSQNGIIAVSNREFIKNVI
jgi:3'-phosphoadenosine 5'-phosphosulfate (PAPS) 3'-phosphatase